jgi:hypothetical protein
MKTSSKIALLVALAPLAAVANEPATSGAASEPVETLKSRLPSKAGFKVDDVRMTDGGIACIKYRVANDNGGESRAQAVVEGEKVLRSTSRSTEFANAWNTKCAGVGGGTK